MRFRCVAVVVLLVAPRPSVALERELHDPALLHRDDPAPPTAGPSAPFFCEVPALCETPARPLSLADVYVERWKAATTEVMAGPGASPLYRDTANRMTAWWRIYEYDRERPWLDEADADRARQLAQLGALAGLERMLRETFERNEVLGVVYRIGSTVSGADLEIRPARGGPRLRYNARRTQVRAAEADIEDTPTSHRHQRKPRPVTRTGVAVQVIDVDESTEQVDPELALVAYLDLRHTGVDALRLQFADTRPGADVQDKGSWSISLRQSLVGELSAFARLTGQESAGWRPVRANTGLDLALPTRREWVLRGQLSRRFPQLVDGTATTSEWRAMVLLRARLAWKLPQEYGGWPLGAAITPRRNPG